MWEVRPNVVLESQSRARSSQGKTMMGNTFRFLHAIEHDGIDIKDRGIYLAQNAAMAAKLASYMERFPGEASAHKADLKLALGDVFAQAVFMCFDAGFDPHEILKLAKIHVRERFQEFEERGWE